MKKIYLPFVFVLSLILLSWCGVSEEDKQDFIVETKPFGDFLREVSISRPGRIAGSTEISVTSQVNGRVSVIYKKDGQNVVGGQQVLNIKDSVANYWLSVQRAKNAKGEIMDYQYSDGTSVMHSGYFNDNAIKEKYFNNGKNALTSKNIVVNNNQLNCIHKSNTSFSITICLIA